MIIDMTTVHALMDYRLTSPLAEMDYLSIKDRTEQIIRTIEDQFKVDKIYAEDLHTSPGKGRFVWWRWDPGMRASELFGGPGDGKVYANCRPESGVELHVYDHERATGPSREKVVIETVYYRLAGYHTINRRWVLKAQP